MPVDPRLALVSVSKPAGVAQRIADLSRRVAKLEGTRTIIGDNSIVGTQITNGAITTSHITAGSIDASLIAANAINAGMIQADAIATVHLQAGAVTAAKIAAGTITAAQIAANTITSGQIAAGTITATQIASGTITATQIAANTITAAKIAAGTITATEIAANTITAAKIAAGTITATELAANSVTATQIAAGAVTALKINVSNLAAISTDMGSISAGTITGATIQTATSGSRVKLDGTGIYGYATDGTTVNFSFNTGSGILTAKGVILADPGSTLPAATITGFIGGGNLTSDSGFESSTPGDWLGWHGTLAIETTAANVHSGGKSGKLTVTDATSDPGIYQRANGAPIKAGETYVASAWIKAPAGRTVYVSARTIDATQAFVALGPSVAAIATGGWQRLAAPAYTVPATGSPVKAGVFAGLRSSANYGGLGGTAAAVSDVFWVDDAQVERGDVATSYAPRPDEILPGTVGTTELVDNAVTNAKIGPSAVDTAQINALAVDGTKIAAGAITTAKLAAGAVTANEIGAGAITTNKLAVTIGGGNILTNGSFDQRNQDGTLPTFASITPWISSNDASSTYTLVASPIKGGISTTALQATTGAVGTYVGAAQTLANDTVEVGKTYTLSAWFRSAVTSRFPALYIQWLTNGGSVVSTPSVTGSVGTTTTGWTRLTLTATAPATAQKAALYARILTTASGETHYYDDVQFEEGDVATAYAPKTNELLPGTVTAVAIRTGAITANEIAANAITATQIQAGAVTTAKMTVNTIDGSVINTNTLDAVKIKTATIDTLQLKAGAVDASIIEAGAVQAQHLTIASPQVAVIKNGTFTDGTTGAAFNNWSDEGPVGTGAWTTEADTTFGQVAKLVVSTAAQNNYRGQTIILPKGRHVFRAWVRGVSVASSTSGGIGLNVNLVSGTATITDPPYSTLNLSGTFDWTLMEAVVDVPGAPATCRVYMQLNSSGAGGTVYFANYHTLSSVTTTEVGPGTINTGHIVAQGLDASAITAGTITALQIQGGTITGTELSVTAIDGFTITGVTVTGGTLQTSTSNPRIIIDADSIRHLDAAGVADFRIPTDPTDTALFRGQINADGGIIQPVDANNIIGPGNKYAWLTPDGLTEVASIGTALAAGSNAYTSLVQNTAGIRDYWKMEDAATPLTNSKGTATLAVSGTAPTYSQSPLIANEPTSKSILWASGKASVDPSTLLGRFAGTNGNALNTFSDNGQAWATSGAATDFLIDTVYTPAAPGGNMASRAPVSEAAGTGRFAIQGSLTFTDVEVGVEYIHPARTGTTQAMIGAVVARWTDANNHVRAQLRRTQSPDVSVLEIVKVVAGVSTTIATTDATLVTNATTWKAIKLSVTPAGKATATIQMNNGGTFRTVTTTATDTVLATGGTLASGKSGIYDLNEQASTGNTKRAFANFYSVIPSQRFDHSNYTVEAWVKPTNVMTDGLEHVILEARSNAGTFGEGFRLSHVNGTVRFYVAGNNSSTWPVPAANTTGYVASSVAMAQNSTYHIAVVVKNPTYSAGVWSGGTVTIYINGVQRGSTNYNTPGSRAYLNQPSPWSLYEGQYGGGSAEFAIANKTTISSAGSPFVGNIDEVAYYPDALLATTKIVNHYNTGNALGTPETKIVASVQAPGGTLRTGVVLDDRGYGQLGAIETVTTLPTTNLYHGMEVYWNVGGSGGETWHMKYLVSGPAGTGWHYLGGGPMRASGGTGASAGTTPTTGAILTGGSQITVPQTGDYFITFYVEGSHSAANGQVAVGYNPNVSGGIGNSTEAYRTLTTSVTAGNLNTSAVKGGPIALTGGNILGLSVRAVNAGTATVGKSWIEIIPKFIAP